MELETLTLSPNQPVLSCRHVSPKGRHCRQAVPAPDSLYCAIHEAKHRSAASSIQLTIDLATQLKEVRSASDITEFLIGVVNLLAENRIPARRAAVLTYIANSIRQSLRDEQREAASPLSGSIWATWIPAGGLCLFLWNLIRPPRPFSAATREAICAHARSSPPQSTPRQSPRNVTPLTYGRPWPVVHEERGRAAHQRLGRYAPFA